MLETCVGNLGTVKTVYKLLSTTGFLDMNRTL